jgi:hypothetical protein
MQGLRATFAAILTVSISTTPLFAAPASALGTVVTAEKAHVGEALVSVGTTVYGGDRLSTETDGSVQVRAGAARLLLASSSVAIVNDESGAASAKLLKGTATFSTANAQAFTLYASRAAIRPEKNGPTIGQVTYLNDKEMIVHATRSDLTVTVDGETQIIPEGTAYRVLLDPPESMMQAPEGAGSGSQGGNTNRGGPPLRAGRSRFLIVAVAVTAVATYLAISESLESPNRP